MARLIALIIGLSLVLPLPALAMSQPIFSAIDTTIITAGDRYFPFASGSSATSNTTVGNAGQPVAVAGTFQDLYADVSVAPGVGTSITLTLYINGSPSSLSCAIADTATTCTDLDDPVSVSAGDSIAWFKDNTGAIADSTIRISMSFTGTTAGDAVLSGGTDAPSNSVDSFYNIYGGTDLSATSSASTTMPVSGTIDQMYVDSGADIGTGSVSFIVRLLKNGENTDLTCTYTGDTNECSDLVHSASFSAGDSIAMKFTPVSSPTARIASWGFRFTPTIDGESPLFMRESTYSNVERYHAVLGVGNRQTSATLNAPQVPIDFTARKLYLAFDTAPGAGTSRTFSLQQSGVSTALSATISDTGLWATDLSDEISFTEGSDTIQYSITVSGSPVTSFLGYASIAAFIDPGTPAASSADPGLIWFFDD